MPAAPLSHHPWLICIDTGGTFTDCLARDSSGVIHRAKVLSTSALRGRVQRVRGRGEIELEQDWGACDDLIAGFEMRLLDTGERLGTVTAFDARKSLAIVHLDEASDRSAQHAVVQPGALIEVRSVDPAPLLAVRLVTRTPAAAGRPLPPMHLRLATTRGTNALLERRGAKFALFITEGFGDLLHIGDQSRPDIFALRIVKPPPLHEHAIEVAERLNADGTILRPLDENRLQRDAMRVRQEFGIDVAAIAFLHSHVNPAHEQRAAAILRRCGFQHITISSEIAPLIRIVPRAQTATVDAYLGPIIGDYLRSVAQGCGPSSRLHVMSSAGSLSDASRFRACESLLSGPAGGVLGAAAAGRASGFFRVIGFDMGGTSTDVCRCDGELEYRFEHRVGDAKLLAPALAIETVAAGGGSICDFVDGRLRVGPQSAGANPGPACYGGGGPLTLTDVNLLLGRLSAEQFEIPVSLDHAEAALAKLLERIETHTHAATHADDVLHGLLEIANQRMAAAIEEVSLRQGYDVRDYALVAFGGAGGQHACDLAQRLGMSTVIMPTDASLLSAAGLMSASIERIAQRQTLQTIEQLGNERLVDMIHTLARQAVADVEAEGTDRDAIDVRRVIANVRLLGQDSTLQVEILADDGDDIVSLLRKKFVARYQQVYGHAPPLERNSIELESLRVVAGTKSNPELEEGHTPQPAVPVVAQQTRRVHLGGEWRDVPAFDRQDLAAGHAFEGPAIVLDRRSSYVIDAGWRAVIDRAGSIVLTRVPGSADAPRAAQPDIVRVELFAHRFMTIAREMGQMLERTALSTNVKERLDFSCTLLDAEGQLIANAPHLPVHLGAMGVCVRSVREAIDMQPGDVIVTNHPAFGGSHLPDITVVTPVFDDRDTLLGYVANRAHHAEMGGTRPGSMPPSATTLDEEGVVIAPMHLVRAGQPRRNAIEKVLRESKYPSRAVADNLADLQAQVAANHRGAAALRDLAQQYGPAEVARQMRALSDRAARLAAAAFDRLPRRVMEAVERLDDGSKLSVRIDLEQVRPVVIDFAGTSEQHPGNLNATPAIVRSAVIYVLRLMVGERLPLNEGLMREVDVRIPRGSMLDPTFDVTDPTRCPAVVGGNVETSQRLVDTLLKALGLAACSQGTMNNTLFGNERFGYYETVCGGSGATAEGDGADAVHTHMTNTRITDPEIIEHRYPVRIERFGIRRGSGGGGRHRGGDGAVREITFLQPMSLSLLTQHRTEQPFGMAGGQGGACGRQQLVRAGTGEAIDLQPIDGCDVRTGDRLVLETPGGGGWGMNSPAGCNRTRTSHG